MVEEHGEIDTGIWETWKDIGEEASVGWGQPVDTYAVLSEDAEPSDSVGSERSEESVEESEYADPDDPANDYWF